MSTSKWKKRWLYDSKVEIPKTTKWRRSSEFIEPAVDDDFRHRDVRQDLSSETIDLGNNISPFKKQRILEDCLSRSQIEKVKPVELDLQTATVKADECGVDAFDYASKRTEMHVLLHSEGGEFFNFPFQLHNLPIFNQ